MNSLYHYTLVPAVIVVLLTAYGGLVIAQNNIGHIEQAKGEIFWKQKITDTEVKLDAGKLKRRKLIVGERFRCGKKAKLVLRLYGKRITITEAHQWFPIPPATRTSKTTDTEDKTGATGGSVAHGIVPPSTVQQHEAAAAVGLKIYETEHSVIEYPLNKEITVGLKMFNFSDVSAKANILRTTEGTRIRLFVDQKEPAPTTVNLYAVDEQGQAVYLMPVKSGEQIVRTSLSRFMLIGSPETNLTSITPWTKIFFKSAVPDGFAVIPRPDSSLKQAASAASNTSAEFTIPMLNVYSLPERQAKRVDFYVRGLLSGGRGNVFITRKGRITELHTRFYDIPPLQHNRAYHVWVVSPNNRFEALGQLNPVGGKAEVKGATTMEQFGLLVSVEFTGDTALTEPKGPWVAVARVD